MMQCVTCNKSSLFAPKIKTLKNYEKDKYPYEFFYIYNIVLKVWDIYSFLYEIEAWKILQCHLNWILIEFRFNWIEYKHIDFTSFQFN